MKLSPNVSLFRRYSEQVYDSLIKPRKADEET